MAEKFNWRRFGKISVVVLIIGYISFAISAFAYRSEEQICSTCKVAILDSATLRFVSPKEVMTFLDQEDRSPLGVRAEFINKKKIEDVLESKSRIKKAECYLTPSGSMVIDITQREPIFRVMTSQSNFYIDSDGGVMRVADNFAAYVPIVTGSVPEKFAKGDLYEFVMYLKNDKLWSSLIEQIDVNEKQELTLVPRVGNQLIRLGKVDGYETKMKKLLSVYKNGFNQLGWNCYKEINLMYEGQVVCTKK